MDQQLTATIRKRIAELVAAREQHGRDAQRVDYGYAAAIGELQRLLASLVPPPELSDEELSALEEELASPDDQDELTDQDDEEEGETNA